ncbi:arsenical-resistance protein [Gilbertella persicaria]|uniref:arsenical-resistance protein n=1 Tax=Gilbertella persicaria TaxID=101096 RepID=UPI002220E1BF|nr:arsenical-resistance protein [Gilbertella persicaria]KAI8061530.1 arsenical-resistance protein [Gilbertella persicaria]
MSTQEPRGNHHNPESTFVCYKTDECKFDYCTNYQEEISQKETALMKKLGFLDRFLVVWILLAMIIGVIIGYFAPHVQESFETVQFGSVSVPIAVGLLVMMYPVLCKIQYERLHIILNDRKIWIQILVSLGINWIIGPIVMTGLAWACLPDLPGFRTGVVMVGLARCIAMVLIWNTLAGGDSDYCAILVAINSILQIALFSPYAMLFINIVPSWFGAPTDTAINVDIWPVAQSVLIYLGIPLLAGIITRYSLRWIKGDRWYNDVFLPHFGPLALVGLIYTIIVMFANQGHHIIANIGSVFRVAVPLFCYFVIMFFVPFFVLKMFFSYEFVVTQSFTAGSNNFELAIAVAVGTYGINSEQALAATIGPLIEVPVLVVFVYATLYMKKKLHWKQDERVDIESK